MSETPRRPRDGRKPPGERREPLPHSRPKPPEEDPAAAERIRKIMDSPGYVRADRDLALLEEDDLRPVRLQLEYLKPERAFEAAGVRATIIVFGGTRILEPAAARRKLEAAHAALVAAPEDAELRRRVAVAERIVAKSRYYDVARELGRIVGGSGEGPLDSRLVVVTGGGPGIMEAANRGAADVGAKTVGLNINLPREQYPNPYITPDLCFQFRYFALRKMHFLLRARALVAFPGGYGTFDELFETLCLIQTRKIDPLPVCLVDEEYWRRAFDADYLADEGTIDPEDADLFFFADSAPDIWQGILDWYEEAGIPILPDRE